jgi:HTH-type transcriptional regulator/antitoxin HipB
MVMDDLERSLNEQLKRDPAFRAAWEESELPARVAKALIGLRMRLNISQAELGRLAGIPQSEISRLESMSHLPSLRTLDKIAGAVGAAVDVSFVWPSRTRKAGTGTDGNGPTPVAAARS